jgi:restriction system protein
VTAFDRKRRGELLRTVLQVLAEHPDGIRARDALATTEERLALTEYETGTFESSGLRRFEKLVRFQTVNAVKAGWMVKDKGTWTITEDGLDALAQYPEPETFMAEAEAQYNAWAKQQPKKDPIGPAPSGGDSPTDDRDGAPSELASVTVEEAEETAFAEIAKHLATMSPYDLQTWSQGFFAEWATTWRGCPRLERIEDSMSWPSAIPSVRKTRGSRFRSSESRRRRT